MARDVKRYLLCLAITFAHPAAADVDCAAMARVMRLHGAVARLHAGAADPAFSENLCVVVTELRTLDATFADQALGPYVDRNSRTAILQFMTRVQRLSAGLKGASRLETLSFLRLGGWHHTLETTAAAFQELPCGPQGLTPVADETGRPVLTEELTDKSPDLPSFGIEDLADKLLAVAMAAAIGGLTLFLALPVLRRWQRLRRRRAKRFPVTYFTRIQMGSQTLKVKIINLSCTGAKAAFRQGGTLSDGDRLVIQLDDMAVEARVVWTNPFYFGVRFSPALGIDAVRHFAATYPVDGVRYFAADT